MKKRRRWAEHPDLFLKPNSFLSDSFVIHSLLELCWTWSFSLYIHKVCVSFRCMCFDRCSLCFQLLWKDDLMQITITFVYTWCICPDPDCSYLIIILSNNFTYFKTGKHTTYSTTFKHAWRDAFIFLKHHQYQLSFIFSFTFTSTFLPGTGSWMSSESRP